ncbi:hypothetical protein RHSIM_Rhsim11G0029700 [Rhododendron simsii]|uniref:Uncharacterized protein n=1 Tax=Rhododendron simsii TaxID=118357 RepID=A0A834LBY1_RHOSS|nr:hypothetical protein RHSIM_Rhsim11G0029700 [Rhododendron simsii]
MIRFLPLSLTLLALISSILYEPSSSSIINPSKAKQASSQPSFQAKLELKRSAVADNESGKSKLSEVRTSSGMFIVKGKLAPLRNWKSIMSCLCCSNDDMQWPSDNSQFMGNNASDIELRRLCVEGGNQVTRQ